MPISDQPECLDNINMSCSGVGSDKAHQFAQWLARKKAGQELWEGYYIYIILEGYGSQHI